MGVHTYNQWIYNEMDIDKRLFELVLKILSLRHTPPCYRVNQKLFPRNFKTIYLDKQSRAHTVLPIFTVEKGIHSDIPECNRTYE